MVVEDLGGGGSEMEDMAPPPKKLMNIPPALMPSPSKS